MEDHEEAGEQVRTRWLHPCARTHCTHTLHDMCMHMHMYMCMHMHTCRYASYNELYSAMRHTRRLSRSLGLRHRRRSKGRTWTSLLKAAPGHISPRQHHSSAARPRLGGTTARLLGGGTARGSLVPLGEPLRGRRNLGVSAQRASRKGVQSSEFRVHSSQNTTNRPRKP